MHGLIFETSIWLLAESTSLLLTCDDTQSAIAWARHPEATPPKHHTRNMQQSKLFYPSFSLSSHGSLQAHNKTKLVDKKSSTDSAWNFLHLISKGSHVDIEGISTIGKFCCPSCYFLTLFRVNISKNEKHTFLDLLIPNRMVYDSKSLYFHSSPTNCPIPLKHGDWILVNLAKINIKNQILLTPPCFLENCWSYSLDTSTIRRTFCSRFWKYIGYRGATSRKKIYFSLIKQNLPVKNLKDPNSNNFLFKHKSFYSREINPSAFWYIWRLFLSRAYIKQICRQFLQEFFIRVSSNHVSRLEVRSTIFSMKNFINRMDLLNQPKATFSVFYFFFDLDQIKLRFKYQRMRLKKCYLWL